MSIIGYLMPEASEACPYLPDRTATMEHFMAESLTFEDLDGLFETGYRHFGGYFYRPICRLCHQCVPIRVPLAGRTFTRGERRILARGSRFTIKLERPHPSRAAYELFLSHKARFESQVSESYRQFVTSFFRSFPWAWQLTIHDGSRLVAVSHVDITRRSISAVYCYYDDSFRRESLGSLAICKEMEIGQEKGLSHLYLGYYVAENRHMSYKARFRPSQVLLEEGRWTDWLDSRAHFGDNNIDKLEFLPRHRLRGEEP